MKKDEFRKMFSVTSGVGELPNKTTINIVETESVYFKAVNYKSIIVDKIKEMYGVNEALSRLTYDSTVKCFLEAKTWLAKAYNVKVNFVDNFDVKVIYEVAFSNKVLSATRHLVLLSMVDKNNAYNKHNIVVVLYVDEQGLKVSKSDIGEDVALNVGACIDLIDRSADAYGITHFKKSYSF
jgi:hypothetical protein